MALMPVYCLAFFSHDCNRIAQIQMVIGCKNRYHESVYNLLRININQFQFAKTLHKTRGFFCKINFSIYFCLTLFFSHSLSLSFSLSLSLSQSIAHSLSLFLSLTYPFLLLSPFLSSLCETFSSFRLFKLQIYIFTSNLIFCIVLIKYFLPFQQTYANRVE